MRFLEKKQQNTRKISQSHGPVTCINWCSWITTLRQQPWQVRGLVDFADANKDGKVDPKEVQCAIRWEKFLKRVAFSDPPRQKAYHGMWRLEHKVATVGRINHEIQGKGCIYGFWEEQIYLQLIHMKEKGNDSKPWWCWGPSFHMPLGPPHQEKPCSLSKRIRVFTIRKGT